MIHITDFLTGIMTVLLLGSASTGFPAPKEPRPIQEGTIYFDDQLQSMVVVVVHSVD